MPWDTAIAESELAKLWKMDESELASLLRDNLKQLVLLA